MELDIVNKQTTWNDAASRINSNFAKIAQWIILNGNTGGGETPDLSKFVDLDSEQHISGIKHFQNKTYFEKNVIALADILPTDGKVCYLGSADAMWTMLYVRNIDVGKGGSGWFVADCPSIFNYEASFNAGVLIDGNEAIHTGNIGDYVFPKSGGMITGSVGIKTEPDNIFAFKVGGQSHFGALIYVASDILPQYSNCNLGNETYPWDSVVAKHIKVGTYDVIHTGNIVSKIQEYALSKDGGILEGELSVKDTLIVRNSASIYNSFIKISQSEISYDYDNAPTDPSVKILFSDHLLTIQSRLYVGATAIVTENQESLRVLGKSVLKGNVEITGNGILTINSYEAIHKGNALSYLQDYTYSKSQIDDLLSGIGGDTPTMDYLPTSGGTINGNLAVTGSLTVGSHSVITTDNIGDYIPSTPTITNVVDLTSNQDIAGIKNFTGILEINGNLLIFDDTEHNEMLLNFNKWGVFRAVNSRLSFEASTLRFNSILGDDNFQFGVGGNSYFDGDVMITGTPSYGSDVRYKDIIENIILNVDDIANAPLFTFFWNNRENSALKLGTSAQYWLGKRSELVNTSSDIWGLDYSTLGVAIGISLARKVVELEQKLSKYES